jgi:membrane-bound ClpP family serine protease
MDHSLIAVLLLTIAIGLIVAEVFIPSGGLITVASLLCLGISIWAAWEAWWEPSPSRFWMFIASVIVVIPGAIAFALYVLPRTPWGQRLFLAGPSPEDVRPFAEEEEGLKALVGEFGRTITPLNPGGLVLVQDKRMHCESEGVMLERDVSVEIIGFKGNRLVVRAGEPPASAFDREREDLLDAEEGETAPAGEAEERPLDFDVPQD